MTENRLCLKLMCFRCHDDIIITVWLKASHVMLISAMSARYTTPLSYCILHEHCAITSCTHTHTHTHAQIARGGVYERERERERDRQIDRQIQRVVISTSYLCSRISYLRMIYHQTRCHFLLTATNSFNCSRLLCHV